MPKKNRNDKAHLPRVSICTPTFNRRPFIKGMIDNILKQKYPMDKVEWIIVDDGTDKIGDLVSHIPFVKYIPLEERMPLGKKRNFMHDQCSFKEDDAIIVYIDDDDYYPPERISHAVEKLTKSNALCAGSSELYLWFNKLKKMYKFGPYGPNHATAGTFAFKRSLLKQTRYEDGAVLAEERFFLKEYTIPFVQLDPLKTILVISHEQNTFDKSRLIDPSNKNCRESSVKASHFIKDDTMLNYYTDEMDSVLKSYQAGHISNKPDVLAEIKRRDDERAVYSQPQVSVTNMDGTQRVLNMNEIIEALQMKTEENRKLRNDLENKDKMIKLLMGRLRTEVEHSIGNSS